MSKRTLSDSGKPDNQPAPKKARYTYDPELMQQRILPRMTTNSDEETVSEREDHHSHPQSFVQQPKEEKTDNNTLFLSTRSPTKSNIPIASEIVSKSEGDWCPVQWFRNRAFHADVNEFFSILPYEEAHGVTKQLLMLNGGSITLINNLLNILNTMQQITEFIHTQTSNSSSSNKHNKRKKRFMQKQNEILNTINIDQLRKNNNNYLHKLQNSIHKCDTNNNEYKSYENESKLIWKSFSNNSITPTPPPHNNNTNNNNNKSEIIKRENKIRNENTNNIKREESDFISTTDNDSDFSILNDTENDCYSRKKNKYKNKNKQRKRKKKKSKKQKLEEEIERERQKEIEAQQQQQDMEIFDGKNPVYADTQPQKFWNKFMGYFEPQNPQAMEELIPYLQSDIFPTKIPALPMEKTFITKSYNFDHINIDDDLSFDDLNGVNGDNHTMTDHDNTDNKQLDSDNELYFAEMPKNYEYFLDRKCYIDEQIKLEADKNNKYVKQKAIHQNYPYNSLYSHSFDQRTLSAIVHECDGLYNIEGNVDENNWKKIGGKKLVERRRREWEKDRDKGKKKGKKRSHYEPIEMIEPVIKYKTEMAEGNDGKITFEKTLRNEICKYIYNGDIGAMNKIVNMPWNQRQDDECCTCIKSLDNNLEEDCYKNAPNDIDTNVKIGQEIHRMIEKEYDENMNNYDAWREFSGHIERLQKNHIDTRGDFVIDQETLNQPQWSQYFKKTQNLPVQQAVQAFMPEHHVETRQED